MTMINFAVWLAAGGLIGWLTSVILYTDGQQCLLRNVVAGVAGAAIGGWIISPLLGVGMGTISRDMFNVGALVVSLVAAVVFLAFINLFRRGPLT